MRQQQRFIFSRYDRVLLVTIVLLIFTGLIILWSATGGDILQMGNQLLHLACALGLLIIIGRCRPRLLFFISPWLYIISIILLVIVLLFGHHANGAGRWLGVGMLRFQPAELVKLTLPMMLAWFFHQLHARRIRLNFLHFFIALIFIIIPAALVAKEPDLGTAIILFLSGLIVIFLAGISWLWFIALFLVIGLAVPVAWPFMKSYQQERVLTFISPQRDPLGTGYHIIQSEIAIGSGGIFGTGLLQGTQAHLHFLPEATTDFIFAVIAEELGVLGVIWLLSLYLAVTVRGLQIAIKSHITFSRLVVGCFSLTFFISALLNISMVSGMLPVVGIPLPLVSYGGTSLITILTEMGILFSVARWDSFKSYK